MGAKRAAATPASQSPKPKTRQRKGAAAPEAAVPEPEPAPVAPLPDWCLPTLGLLDTPAATSELPVSCREMVAAMLPKSGLDKALNDRNQYQQQFLDSLSECFDGLQANCQAGVATAEASITSLESEKDGIESKLGDAKQKADELRAVRDAKKDAWKKAIDATGETDTAIAAAEKQVKNHEAEHKHSQLEVEQLGQLMTTKFTPLKEFSIPGTKWRLRDRTAKEVADALASFSPGGIEDSLRDALKVAFRKRPAENETFATMTIEYAEKLVTKHLENRDAKIKSFETEAQSRAAALTAAQEAAKEARKHQDEVENEYIMADNNLLEADTLANNVEKEEKQMKPRAAQLATTLESAKAELTKVQSFVTSFEALRKGTPEAAATEVSVVSDGQGS